MGRSTGFELAAPQVLTELATNAALHARSAYTVHLRAEPDAVLIEVTDSSPALPQARHYGTGATTGRGIALVEALSAAWGVESSPTGKTVWCRVRSDDELPDFADDERRRGRRRHADHRPSGGRAAASRRAGPGVRGMSAVSSEELITVQIVGLPTDLQAEAQQQTDELTRELMLVAEQMRQKGDAERAAGPVRRAGGER